MRGYGPSCTCEPALPTRPRARQRSNQSTCHNVWPRPTSRWGLCVGAVGTLPHALPRLPRAGPSHPRYELQGQARPGSLIPEHRGIAGRDPLRALQPLAASSLLIFASASVSLSLHKGLSLPGPGAFYHCEGSMGK